MNGINTSFTSIEQVTGQYLNQSDRVKRQNSSELTFEGILKKQLGMSELKFSKHATQRLDDRGISLTEDQNIRLEEGVMKASEKGIKDSLVLVDSLAFIVNVPNSTVVTAIDQTEADSDVFTNIDGAVIA